MDYLEKLLADAADTLAQGERVHAVCSEQHVALLERIENVEKALVDPDGNDSSSR
jgi:hypothetical protein